MSLRTADFFLHAVKDSEEVTAIVDDRIYLPARPTVDENADTIPYMIVMPSNVTNNADTKDDGVEGDEDTANVSILCVARSHDELMDLCESVREACASAWEVGEDPQTPVEWNFSATDELYDPSKPCNYLTLNYQCITERIYYERSKS